ncbi:ribosomal protein l15 [Plakobranchus ocellatus]|uniref:Ribosomal protein l15 n=1 Tax=Plakobranchus ocellatus TaxID=259542 RepID=A0AAV3Y526_9GAST|nr:ribosomal protein l15 [Plakobranchus ocellatus]
MFINDIDREVLAQLIEGVTPSKLRRKALRDRLILSQFIAEARDEELTDTQTKEIEASTERACPISARTHKKGAAKSKPWNPNPNTRIKQNTNSRCRDCGGPFPHSTSCPAKGKACLNCKKPNHFAKVCRSKKAEVKQITEGSSETEEIFTLRSSKKVPTTSVVINNQNISFIIDTGASVNVITEATYNNMKKKPQLKPSSTVIYGYKAVQKLPVLGCFTSTASHKKYAIKAMSSKIVTSPAATSSLLQSPRLWASSRFPTVSKSQMIFSMDLGR